jgi:hypothetical protein
MISSTACRAKFIRKGVTAPVSTRVLVYLLELKLERVMFQFLLVINTFDMEHPVSFSTLPEVDPFPERFWQQLDCQSRRDTRKRHENSSKVTVKKSFFFLTIANVFSRGSETFSKN